METLKFRIDSRIVKTLKLKKKLKLEDLVEIVIHDLSLQVQMAQNQEQLEARKADIRKRVDDLANRVFIKKEGQIVEYIAD